MGDPFFLQGSAKRWVSSGAVVHCAPPAGKSVTSPAACGVHGISFIFPLLKHSKLQRNAGGTVDETFDANTLLFTDSSKANELLLVFSESRGPHPAIKNPLWSPQCTSTGCVGSPFTQPSSCL